MSEDKQLTVAELLARAREDNPDKELAKPRRRRSLEEGGISVAELTGSFPKVEATPPQSRHSDEPLDEEPEAESVEEPEVVEPESSESEAKEMTAEHPIVGEPAPSVEDTAVMSAVDDDHKHDIAEPEQELSSASPEEEGSEESSAGGGIGMVILMAVAGVVLGAVVFWGFNMMWGRLPMALNAVLGLAVTGVMVGVVHALRTSRDALTMGLAAVVGLVLTFGPALLNF